MSLVPYGPFAGPSSECLTLFRDGRFYGCIALTQAVIEALVRHVWQTKMKMKRTKAGSDESNLKSLCSLGVINTDLKTRLDLLWIERNDFHHLNPGIETDRNKLEAIALKNLQMLGDLERSSLATRSMRECSSQSILSTGLLKNLVKSSFSCERGHSLAYPQHPTTLQGPLRDHPRAVVAVAAGVRNRPS